MPSFTPSGTIRIGRVPFDNSYRHTMTFDSASAQQSYFASVCTQSLSRSDYTYVRMNNSIRVPFNAEQLYTYNYVMYQNSNYGNKWFYAFIVDVQYLNKATTELVLELDVMQTWYFDYTLTQGFVEREHVSDDTRGAHTVPEPDMGIMYECDFDRTVGSSFNDRRVIIQTTQTPNFDMDWIDNFLGTTTISVTGGYYDRIWNGSKYLCFNQSQKDEIKAFFNFMNQSGAAEAITSVFLFPTNLLPQSGGRPSVGSDYGVQEDTDPPEAYVQAVRHDTLGTYTPRNNKLFTYPYNYLELIDNNGNSAQYRWELFELSQPEGAQSGYWFRVYSVLDPQATAILSPMNYANAAVNTAETFTFPVTTQLSWVYSAYQNWLAQNSLALATSVASSLTSFGLGASQGLSKAAGYLGLGQGAHNRLTSTYGESAVRGVAGELAYDATSGLPSEALSVSSDLLGAAGDWYRMAHVPNRTCGRASDPTMVANNLQTVYQMNVYPTPEYCRIIDDFFDMYGYEVDEVKVPNRTGRPSWNYVKMRNSCHHGNVPASDMARINAIYDSGITFWHTSDVGNYSLNNQP